MARRTFDVIDIVEILVHWHAGRPIAVVVESLGTDRKTIRKYVAPAEAAGLAPGGPPLSRDQWAALVGDWFPQLSDPRARSQTHAVIDAHRERIVEMLKSNKPTTVHQRLRDEHGLAVGISSFRRYVWHRRGLSRRCGDQDLGQGRARPPDRLGGLPAPQGGLLHAHAHLVPPASR